MLNFILNAVTFGAYGRLQAKFEESTQLFKDLDKLKPYEVHVKVETFTETDNLYLEAINRAHISPQMRFLFVSLREQLMSTLIEQAETEAVKTQYLLKGVNLVEMAMKRRSEQYQAGRE